MKKLQGLRLKRKRVGKAVAVDEVEIGEGKKSIVTMDTISLYQESTTLAPRN